MISNIGRQQSVRKAWEMFKDGFNSEFISFVEQKFSDADAQSLENKGE